MAALLCLDLSSLDAGVFKSDFNSGTPRGTEALGNAVVNPSGGLNDSGVLRLTPADKDKLGNFIIEKLDPEPVVAFVANFKALIGNGYRSGADGFSFSLARKIPNRLAEEGAKAGLAVSFRTYTENGRGPHLVVVRYDGQQIASEKAGNLRTGNSFVDVEIKLESNRILNVTYDGRQIIKDLFVENYVPMVGKFAFAARTGDIVDNHLIDDLSIATATEGQPRLARLHRTVVEAEPFLYLNNGETLNGLLYKPRGKGPFPAAVFCQSGVNSATEEEMKLRFQALAELWVSRGYVFLAPGRPRFSLSSSELETDLMEENEYHSRNLLIAVQVLKSSSYVDENRVVLMGEGAGADAILFSSIPELGVRSLLLFSVGSNASGKPRLQTRLKSAIQEANVPIYLAESSDAAGMYSIFAQLLEQKGSFNRWKNFSSVVSAGERFAEHAPEVWSDEVFSFLKTAVK